MDDDHLDLARHLFATATALLEDATETATEGQSPRLGAERAEECARRLRKSADDLVSLADAALVALRHGRNPPGK